MSSLRRLLNVLRPGRLHRDIEREVSFHLAERADQLRAQGLSDEEATLHARRQFGNVTVQQERTRDEDVAAWMDTLVRNLRYAVRTLARTPGFTITVVLTLALAIGANSTVFSAIDAILLRPLPFPDPGRLVRLSQTEEGDAATNIAPARLEDWNQLSSTFEAISGYYVEDVSETSGDVPERVRRAVVAPRFLDVWGIEPGLGRDFLPQEQQFAGPSAVLISNRYWSNRLGADPGVLGQSVRIGGSASPVVGVMPESFQFPDRDVDLWFPARVPAQYAENRELLWYTGIGRLESGVGLTEARANLGAVQAQLGARYPDTDAAIRIDIEPLKETTVGGVRGSLWLVFGAVSILLLIACTNISALLLSRAAQRRQEIAVRLALGASRRAVTAQMLTETAVLALAGGGIGLLLAAGASATFRSLAPDLPRLEEVAIDGRILLYTLLSTATVALLCGMLPSVWSARGAGVLGKVGRTQVSQRHRLQWALVGAQVALSVMLLAGAGLLLRSFQELSRVDPGFESSHVLTFEVSGSYAETANWNRLIQRIDGTLETLRALPGVEEAATSMMVPGVPGQYQLDLDLVEGRDATEPRMAAEYRPVSPSYFSTMRIPLLAGELCRHHDGVPMAMVNRAFAHGYLRGSSAIGLHLARDGAEVGRIVGIVGDARERGIDHDPVPTVYPCRSAPGPMPSFLVRTSGDPMAIARDVRLSIKEIEPLRSVYDITPLDRRIGDAFAQNRLRTVSLVFFAATALCLTCVALYGTLSYVVRLRRREVGLRLALGALRSDILRQFLGKSLFVVGLACVVGLALSFAFTRVLAGMLYGVSPSDPATLSGVVAIVLAVAALASLLPAARAAFLQPMRVLRDE